MAAVGTLLTSNGSCSNLSTGTGGRVFSGGNGDYFVQLPVSKAMVAIVDSSVAGTIQFVIVPNGGSPQAPINTGLAVGYFHSISVDLTADIVYLTSFRQGYGTSWTYKYSINVSGNTITQLGSIQPNTGNAPYGYQSATEIQLSSSMAVGVATFSSSGANSSGTVYLAPYVYNPNGGTSTAPTLGTTANGSTPSASISGTDSFSQSSINFNQVAGIVNVAGTLYALWGDAGTNTLYLSQLAVTSTTVSVTTQTTFSPYNAISANQYNIADICTDGTVIYIAYVSSATQITVARYNNGTTTVGTISITTGAIRDIQIRYFNSQLYVVWSDTQSISSGEAVYAVLSTTGTIITNRTVVAGGDAYGYTDTKLSIVGNQLICGYMVGTGSPSSAYYTPLATQTTGTNVSITSVVATSTANAPAPTIAVTSPNATVNAIVASSSANAVIPTVSTQKQVTISPPVATTSVNGIVTNVRTDTVITSVVASSTTSTLVPTLAVDTHISAVVANTTVNAIVPSVSSSVNASVNAAVATVSNSTIAPTITTQQQVSITDTVANVTANVLTPSIATYSNATITDVIATVSSNAISPIIQAQQQANINTAVANINTNAVVPSVGSMVNTLINAIAAISNSDAKLPTIATQQQVSINAVRASATTQGISPVISPQEQVNISSVVANSNSDMDIPNVGVGVSANILSTVVYTSNDAINPSIETSSNVNILAVTTNAIENTIAPSIVAIRNVIVNSIVVGLTLNALIPQVFINVFQIIGTINLQGEFKTKLQLQGEFKNTINLNGSI